MGVALVAPTAYRKPLVYMALVPDIQGLEPIGYDTPAGKPFVYIDINQIRGVYPWDCVRDRLQIRQAPTVGVPCGHKGMPSVCIEYRPRYAATSTGNIRSAP